MCLVVRLYGSQVPVYFVSYGLHLKFFVAEDGSRIRLICEIFYFLFQCFVLAIPLCSLLGCLEMLEVIDRKLGSAELPVLAIESCPCVDNFLFNYEGDVLVHHFLRDYRRSHFVEKCRSEIISLSRPFGPHCGRSLMETVDQGVVDERSYHLWSVGEDWPIISIFLMYITRLFWDSSSPLSVLDFAILIVVAGLGIPDFR